MFDFFTCIHDAYIHVWREPVQNEKKSRSMRTSTCAQQICKHVWLLATENTTESSNPSGIRWSVYTHFLEFVTVNLHRYSDREIHITCMCIVQCNFVTSDFASDCGEPNRRGAVKRGLTVQAKKTFSKNKEKDHKQKNICSAET